MKEFWPLFYWAFFSGTGFMLGILVTATVWSTFWNLVLALFGQEPIK